jgi:hypothetical protein
MVETAFAPKMRMIVFAYAGITEACLWAERNRAHEERGTSQFGAQNCLTSRRKMRSFEI